MSEPFSAQSAVLLDSGATLLAPGPLFAEATSALAAKHRLGDYRS